MWSDLKFMSRVAPLPDASAVSLLGRPVWLGTQQTIRFPSLMEAQHLAKNLNNDLKICYVCMDIARDLRSLCKVAKADDK
jgi:hypothetical protein